ncbi:MAG: gluconeogenesis factor YvcK family protein [bacterium]
MKKIVIFGGGSGLSQLLKGLKLFPLDITAVVSVADNGSSTGKLREELNIPAVGDITKVMLSMSSTNSDVIDLLNYRFTKSKTLGSHSVKNLLLTALLDLKGNFDDAIDILSDVFKISGTILPLTEDSVHLVADTDDGLKVIGEEQITNCSSKILKLSYDREFTINPRIYDAIDSADLIIFSSGSLCTSIIPHIISKELSSYISSSKCEKLYVCNLFTQPGETDDFDVADHIDYLENYFPKKSIDIVIANNNIIDDDLARKYLTCEQKEFVLLDRTKIKDQKLKIIESDLVIVEEDVFRHDSLKTAYLIFRYLMEGE